MRQGATPSEIVVAVTGASGSLYGLRFLQAAAAIFSRVHVVVSARGAQVMEHELGLNAGECARGLIATVGGDPQRLVGYAPEDMLAPFASGSAHVAGMAIVPCSMGTAARVAAGVSDDLITRAADVMLKERRPLVLVPRESPLSSIHLRNLLTLAEAGAVVLPAMPPFYHRPETIDDLVGMVVNRALRQFGVEPEGAYAWGEP
jgi:4-hydroxy-3-polyprenylbenzoate decarboxylase